MRRLLAAVAAAAAVVLVYGGTSQPALAASDVAPPDLPDAAAQVQSELAGIPQHGLSLGFSTARVQVVEYADLACAACATTSTTVLPQIIAQYVSAGTVSLEFEPIVESPLSDQLALGAYAAGTQDGAWGYIQLAYLRSTATSNGPLDTPATLVNALGLNLTDWQTNVYRPRWAAAIAQTEDVATIAGFTGYPAFVIRTIAPHRHGHRTAHRRATILTSPVSLAQLSRAIDAALPATTSRIRQHHAHHARAGA